MNLSIRTRNAGRPGATFLITFGSREMPFGLSVAAAVKLRDELTLALEDHATARVRDTDALVARSDANALDALTRALDRP